MKDGTTRIDLLLARQHLVQCLVNHYGESNLNILMPSALIFMREKKYFDRQQQMLDVFLDTLQKGPPVFAGEPYFFPMTRELLSRLITFDGWIPGKLPPSPVYPGGQDTDGDINDALEMVRDALSAYTKKMQSRRTETQR